MITCNLEELWYLAHLEESWKEAFSKKELPKESKIESQGRKAFPHVWFKNRIKQNRWCIYWSEDYVWPHDGSVQGHVPSLEKKQEILKAFYKSKEKK